MILTRRGILRGWKNALFEDPKAGPVIKGTGGARKFRFAFEDQGKSGSARIIYVDFEIGEKICGLAAYAKTDKGSLTESEKKAIKKMIDTIEPYYNRPNITGRIQRRNNHVCCIQRYHGFSE